MTFNSPGDGAEFTVTTIEDKDGPADSAKEYGIIPPDRLPIGNSRRKWWLPASKRNDKELDPKSILRSTSSEDHARVEEAERLTDPCKMSTSFGFNLRAGLVPSDEVTKIEGASISKTLIRIVVSACWVESETVRVMAEMEPTIEEDDADTWNVGEVEEGEGMTPQVDDKTGDSWTHLHW
jgi:hypothetical protein